MLGHSIHENNNWGEMSTPLHPFVSNLLTGISVTVVCLLDFESGVLLPHTKRWG